MRANYTHTHTNTSPWGLSSTEAPKPDVLIIFNAHQARNVNLYRPWTLSLTYSRLRKLLQKTLSKVCLINPSEDAITSFAEEMIPNLYNIYSFTASVCIKQPFCLNIICEMLLRIGGRNTYFISWQARQQILDIRCAPFHIPYLVFCTRCSSLTIYIYAQINLDSILYQTE